MTVNETTRTLYLLRHAKAKAPQPGQPDAARELTGRGRRARRPPSAAASPHWDRCPSWW